MLQYNVYATLTKLNAFVKRGGIENEFKNDDAIKDKTIVLIDKSYWRAMGMHVTCVP